jgi:hypothetical protein
VLDVTVVAECDRQVERADEHRVEAGRAADGLALEKPVRRFDRRDDAGAGGAQRVQGFLNKLVERDDDREQAF